MSETAAVAVAAVAAAAPAPCHRTVSAFFPSLLLRLKLKKDLRFFLALSSPDAPKSRVEDDVTEAESDSCSLLSAAAALVGWTFTLGGVVFKLA